jgi:TolB-like protein/Tfp pilus assembly protein PilF
VIGSQISHYRILSKLGEGGMGEVFLALDTKLDRKVALKFLPPHFASDPEALERFKREARSAAALQHPNIVTIHEIGEHEDRHFIVMAYIEGALLSDLIASDDLTIEKALYITLRLADALGEAHKAGIVHRDLKPDNILSAANGRPHGLDFGLAVTSGATKLTQEGTTVGTLHYMSPEQSRGESVDERTDIFSLGAITYEMITKRRAFPGDHAAAIHYKIASEDPQPLSRYNNKATPELERVVSTMLAKDRDVRYQTMSGVMAAIKPLRGGSQISGVGTAVHPARSSGHAKWIATAIIVLAIAAAAWWVAPRFRTTGEQEGTLAGRVDALAVLPFEQVARDPEKAYFADGLTVALTNELGSVSALNVISNYTMMQYKDAKKPLPEIGDELGVDAFVQGSVQHVGDQVRINVELILARNSERLWGQAYDSEVGDLLRLQSDIAREITRHVQVTLSPFEDQRLRRVRAVDPEALRAYLKGVYYRELISHEGLIKGRESFERAIALAPNFALAHVALADIYHWGWYFSSEDDVGDLRDKAIFHAKKALELDPGLADAHALLAEFKLDEWDWAAAENEIAKAREVNEKSPAVRMIYSDLLMMKGDLAEGLAQHRSAVASNPLSHPVACNLPKKYYLAREYDVAVNYGRHAAERFPTCPWERIAVAQALVSQGKYDEAIEEFEASYQTQETLEARVGVARAHALAGRTEEARRTLKELIADGLGPCDQAKIYVALHDYESAFASLDVAFEKRSGGLAWLHADPSFEALRGDPRFADLVARVGL